MWAIGALVVLFVARPALAGSAYSPEGTPPDSAVATLRVETIPSGLTVFVDGVKVGRSPVGPMWVPAKPVTVQAISDDPRRFEATRDTVMLYPRPGQALQATIDLRPSVLIRSTPEPASVRIAARGAGRADSLIGQTPMRVAPKGLERRMFVFEAPLHADSAMSGESILALASTGGPVNVTLRRVAPKPEAQHSGRRSIFRRKVVQLALIGVGVALTGTSARLRSEADTWYERYLASSDPVEIPRLYDQTVHYDHLAGESLVVGQALLTAGIFLLVTTDDR
jgi:PEGA domain